MINKKLFSLTLLGYGLILLMGGIMGHVKAASNASLIAGTVSAIIVLISAAGVYKSKPWGVVNGLGVTFLLFLFFAYRYLLTHKFMPSGFMSLFSLAVLFVLFFLQRRKAPSY